LTNDSVKLGSVICAITVELWVLNRFYVGKVFFQKVSGDNLSGDVTRSLSHVLLVDGGTFSLIFFIILHFWLDNVVIVVKVEMLHGIKVLVV
jgi:hypothetical protein